MAHRLVPSRTWFVTSPPIWLLLLSAMLCAKGIYEQSLPMGIRAFSPPITCLYWPVCALILLDYGIRLVSSVFRGQWKGATWRWFCTPVFVALVITAMQTDWLLQIRFERSRSALEATAGQLLKGPASAPESLEQMRNGFGFPDFLPYRKPVGSYTIQSVSVFPQERVVYFLTGGFFRSGWGFVYDPDGHDPAVRDIRCVKTLAPGWYVFYFAKP